MRKYLLGRVADLSCSHPLALVLGGALLTVLSIFGIARLHFETGLADYLPEDSPVVSLFTRAIEH